MTPDGRDDDAPWRRPPGYGGDAREPAPAEPSVPGPVYSGPPPTVAPPARWRPPVVVRPPAPRTLPAQDHDAIDAQEQTARTLTVGVGLVAGAVIVVLLLLICGRALF